MSHAITPDSVGSLALTGATIAPHGHPVRRRSLAGWLRILVESLVEAQRTHATYHDLIGQGVEPGVAIRMAFAVQHGRHQRPCQHLQHLEPANPGQDR